MYTIGDLVIYSSHGICRITDICEKTYSGITRTYYVMHPIENNNLLLNLPVDHADGIIQRLLNRKEAEEILHSFTKPGMEWPEKNQDRIRMYSAIIKTGDRMEIAKIINTIMRKQNDAERNGKKLGESERKILMSTQHILFKELSILMGVPIEAIAEQVDLLMQQSSEASYGLQRD